jgi:hypothetical protein
MLGIYRVAAQLVASRVMLSSTELVRWSSYLTGDTGSHCLLRGQFCFFSKTGRGRIGLGRVTLCSPEWPAQNFAPDCPVRMRLGKPILDRNILRAKLDLHITHYTLHLHITQLQLHITHYIYTLNNYNYTLHLHITHYTYTLHLHNTLTYYTITIKHYTLHIKLTHYTITLTHYTLHLHITLTHNTLHLHITHYIYTLHLHFTHYTYTLHNYNYTLPNVQLVTSRDVLGVESETAGVYMSVGVHKIRTDVR